MNIVLQVRQAIKSFRYTEHHFIYLQLKQELTAPGKEMHSRFFSQLGLLGIACEDKNIKKKYFTDVIEKYGPGFLEDFNKILPVTTMIINDLKELDK